MRESDNQHHQTIPHYQSRRNLLLTELLVHWITKIQSCGHYYHHQTNIKQIQKSMGRNRQVETYIQSKMNNSFTDPRLCFDIRGHQEETQSCNFGACSPTSVLKEHRLCRHHRTMSHPQWWMSHLIPRSVEDYIGTIRNFFCRFKLRHTLIIAEINNICKINFRSIVTRWGRTSMMMYGTNQVIENRVMNNMSIQQNSCVIFF